MHSKESRDGPFNRLFTLKNKLFQDIFNEHLNKNFVLNKIKETLYKKRKRCLYDERFRN